MQTEYEFELPKGYVDSNGDVHKKGTMSVQASGPLQVKGAIVKIN